MSGTEYASFCCGCDAPFWPLVWSLPWVEVFEEPLERDVISGAILYYGPMISMIENVERTERVRRIPRRKTGKEMKKTYDIL